MLKAPFFEIGPKAYMYGDEMLSLAIAADEAAREYDVGVILTPQAADIRLIAENTSDILVFAQHFDPIPAGRGLGMVLPEAVVFAGAAGVMLNHAECQMTVSNLRKAIKRARELGIYSIVCADSLEDARAVATFSPDIIVAEPSELIGTGQTSDEEYVRATTEAIHSVNSGIHILQAAGIKDANDVYRIILAGAEATGSTSGIMKAADPCRMAKEMIAAVRKAWNEVHKQQLTNND
jgi:triosephosphate isomerase